MGFYGSSLMYERYSELDADSLMRIFESIKMDTDLQVLSEAATKSAQDSMQMNIIKLANIIGTTPKAINDSISIAAATIIKHIKTYGTKNLLDIVTDTVKKSIDSIANQIKAASNRNLEIEVEPEKFGLCLLLLYMCILVNSIALIVLGTLLGQFGVFLRNTIVAPIIEELAKSIAAKNGCSTAFVTIFNFCEFNSYVFKYASSYGLVKTIVVRLMVTQVHTFNQLIHTIANDSKFQKILNMNNYEKEKSGTIAYFICVFIHAFWNGCLSNIIAKIIF